MLDETTFKQSLALFASGVTTITWQENDAIQGITVSAFSSLSLNPPLVLFCIAQSAYVHPTLCKLEYVCINILSSEQTALAYQFAGADRNNLNDAVHYSNAQQQPMLKKAQANLLVRIRERIAQGDHDIFIAELIESQRNPESAPLLYFNGKISSGESITNNP